MKHFTIILLMVVIVWQVGQSQIYPDRHTTNAFDGWISCEKSNNPNPVRGSSHWIRYDFGQTYALHDVIFWNMNHPDHLVNGIKNILVEYSSNGSTWNFVDTFTVPKAPASGFYEGVKGPDLGGINARYLLITAVDNHGGGCYGLSEIRVYTQPVNPSEFVLNFSPCESDGIYKNLTGGMNNGGTYSGPGVIDNGDETFNFDVVAVGPGTYTINYSAGNLSTNVTVLPCTNPGCPDCEECDPADILNVPGNPIASNTYSAHRVISTGRVSSSGNVEFKGFINVELDPGFEVNPQGFLSIDLGNCEENASRNGSFENDLADWQFNNWGSNASGVWQTTNTDPIDGSKVMQVTTTVTGSNPGSWEVNLRQRDLSVVANQSYTISFYARADNGGVMRYEAYLSEGPETDYVDRSVTLFDHWTKFEASFIADVNSSKLDFLAHFGSQAGIYYIDHVKLVENK